MIAHLISHDNDTLTKVIISKRTARGAYTTTGQFIPKDRIIYP